MALHPGSFAGCKSFYWVRHTFLHREYPVTRIAKFILTHHLHRDGTIALPLPSPLVADILANTPEEPKHEEEF